MLPTAVEIAVIAGVPSPRDFTDQSTVGRSWPIWPTVSRVTIGSADETRLFVDAVRKLMA